MKRFDTVLFDLDGTLSDSQEGICKCVSYALESFGIHETDEEKLRLFIGPPLDAMFMKLYGFSPRQAEKARWKYRERYQDTGIYENRPYEGIREMLSALKEAGILLGVATSKPEGYARRILEKDGLLAYFDVVSGADMEGKRGSKTDVLLEAIRRRNRLKMQEKEGLTVSEENPPERIAADPKEGKDREEADGILNGPDGVLDRADRILAQTDGILMVGDRKYDVEGARECHVPCVGVGFGFAPQGELEAAGADYLAETVADLQKLLLEIAGPER